MCLSRRWNRCWKEEFEKIQRAVMLVNKYYDSHMFLFAKRRFADYAARQDKSQDVSSCSFCLVH
jgi:hypothetical protein